MSIFLSHLLFFPILRPYLYLYTQIYFSPLEHQIAHLQARTKSQVTTNSIIIPAIHGWTHLAEVHRLIQNPKHSGYYPEGLLIVGQSYHFVSAQSQNWSRKTTAPQRKRVSRNWKYSSSGCFPQSAEEETLCCMILRSFSQTIVLKNQPTKATDLSRIRFRT